MVQAAASTAGGSRGVTPQMAERALSMESAASASLSTAAIPKGTHHPTADLLCFCLCLHFLLVFALVLVLVLVSVLALD